MATALYRLYRPKKLADLLGQEQVTTVLQNAAAADKIGHAYLLYGTRGTGKTTAARILAKICCCATRQKDAKFRAKGEPCNTCDPCTEIDSGRSVDVIEIDAASNNKVEQVRELIEGARLSPASYVRKVIILDEVHMLALSRGSFNALLKTLEEPPAHLVFIMATTELDKVPATIASRCQRFHFRRLPIDFIIEKLTSIIKSEKLKVDAEAIELLAALGDGSLRDAESLLAQITSLNDAVTADIIEKHLGRLGFNRVAGLAQLILEKKLPECLAQVSKLHEEGHNIVDLTKQLIHYFRRLLTLTYNPDLESLFKQELTGKELTELRKQVALIDPARHIPLIKALITSYSQMRYSPFPTIPLEVAIIEQLKS